MSWKEEVEGIEQRRRLAKALGGAEAVEKQHERGRLTIRERIDALADAESFTEEGPIAGTLVMGRALNDDRLATLRERTEVDFAWHQLDESTDATESELAAILDSPSASVRHRQTGSSRKT